VKRLILLADDSPTIQRLVAQTFHDGNFEVVAVSNGDAAIRKFEEVRPELVLADIYMPGKNGYEVCAVVKKHPELGGTPVVLLAGAFDAYDEETASQVGAAAHITKPFEPHALVNLVVSLLPKEAPKRAAAGAAQPVTSTIPHPASMPKESALPVSAPPTPVPNNRARTARRIGDASCEPLVGPDSPEEERSPRRVLRALRASGACRPSAAIRMPPSAPGSASSPDHRRAARRFSSTPPCAPCTRSTRDAARRDLPAR